MCRGRSATTATSWRAPALPSRTSSSTLAVETVDRAASAQAYYLYIGTSEGSKDVLDTGSLSAATTSYPVPALPVGKTLWHAGTGAEMQTSPITYELDGRQYVVSGSGGVMFAWALPAAKSTR